MKVIIRYFRRLWCAVFGMSYIDDGPNVSIPGPYQIGGDMNSDFMIPFNDDQFADVVGIPAVTSQMDSGDSLKLQAAKSSMKAVKPKDVVEELERVPTNFSLIGLDEKIGILKCKQSMITQNYAKREVTALIQCMENRKLWNKYKEFFTNFDATTGEKIDDLIKKYPNLKMGDSDMFVPEFPTIAVKLMEKYTEKVKEVMKGKKPIYYVIAQIKDFKRKVERRDPILLAQSPFGFYYYILGAWDEEMILLSEL